MNQPHGPANPTWGPAIGDEIERRLRRISQMRNFFIQSRRSMMKAYLAGKYPHKPPYDIRSDHEYWLRRSEEINNTK